MLPGQSTAASKNGCVMEQKFTLTNFELHSSLCFCLLCLIWAAVAVKWCRSTRCRQSELAASHPHLQQRGGQEGALLISADEREKLGTGQDTKRILRAARARGDIFRLTVSWCPSLETVPSFIPLQTFIWIQIPYLDFPVSACDTTLSENPVKNVYNA